jgi:hypothetical protein
VGGPLRRALPHNVSRPPSWRLLAQCPCQCREGAPAAGGAGRAFQRIISSSLSPVYSHRRYPRIVQSVRAPLGLKTACMPYPSFPPPGLIQQVVAGCSAAAPAGAGCEQDPCESFKCGRNSSTACLAKTCPGDPPGRRLLGTPGGLGGSALEAALMAAVAAATRPPINALVYLNAHAPPAQAS